MKTFDFRDMACPLPVINTKKELEHYDALTVLVDDGAAHENVTRFAKNRGYSVNEVRQESGWALTLTVDPTTELPTAAEAEQNGASVFLVTSDRLGDGPEELGRLLMKNFINTLLECDSLPNGIYFMNSGVRLTCEGSDSLEALEKMANLGVEVRSCGLCLDYFNLKERLRVGITTNMLSTAEALLNSPKVIRL